MVETSKVAGIISLTLAVIACVSLVYTDWKMSEERLNYSANAASDTEYLLVNTRMTYDEARDKCEAMGLTLATLDTEAKWTALRDETSNEAVWIGYRVEAGSENNKNAWKWESGAPPSLDKWASGRPRKDASWPQEYCAMLNTQGEFINIQCNSRMPFVCDTHPSVEDGEVNQYIVQSGHYTWDYANDECRKRFGTTLASVQGATEQARLRNGHWMWVGLRVLPGKSEIVDESDFEYTSGVKSAVQPYWEPNNPVLGTNTRYCVSLSNNGRMYTRNCQDRLSHFACDSKLLNPEIQNSRFEWHYDRRVGRNQRLPAKAIVFGQNRGYRLTLQVRLTTARQSLSNILRVGNSQDISMPSINQAANRYAVQIVQTLGNGGAESAEKTVSVNQWRRFDIESNYGGLKVSIDNDIVFYDSAHSPHVSDPQFVWLSDNFMDTASADIRYAYFYQF